MPRRSLDSALLALDLGTSSVRTALFDARAQPIPDSGASQTYRMRHTAEHGAELDPAVLLRATRKCLHQTCRLTTPRPRAVAGSSFWHSLLGLDRAGEPLTPVYTWADARGAQDAARLRAEVDEHEIQQRTGCMLRASFWPAKLRWLRRTQPKLFRRVRRWVSPAEWIFEKIWDVRECSHSMASGTGLYDCSRHDWDDELVDAVCLTRAHLGLLQDSVEREGARVFNRPAALRNHPEKLAILEFPQFITPTLVTRDGEALKAFHAEHRDIILKPLDGMGGTGIFRVGPDGLNLGSIVETLNGTAPHTRTVMAQRYLTDIVKGDKRVLVIGGKPVPHALARVPQGSEIRGNLAVGGKGVAQPLSARDREIAEHLGPILAARGLLLVGLDVIGDCLTEINVTSPTGFQEITAQSGFDVAAMFLDALEAALR